jgi:hypothetical protein
VLLRRTTLFRGGLGSFSFSGLGGLSFFGSSAGWALPDLRYLRLSEADDVDVLRAWACRRVRGGDGCGGFSFSAEAEAGSPSFRRALVRALSFFIGTGISSSEVSSWWWYCC